ncbi:hypothetical protein CBL_03248 [Carabus blaptoides fortunei]
MYSPEYICLWHILDYSHKILLGLCVYIFGFTAVILNGWLTYAFVKSRLLTFRSHLLLLALCIASETKSLLTGFIFFGTSALAGRWIFGTSTCHLFAFLRQLLGVFQIMMLTLISVERYIMSRPKRKVDLPLRFYIIGIAMCWSCAIVFSLPPLLGYGSYNCDVSGTMCDLDWRMLTSQQIGFNIMLMTFGAIIPVMVILCCLWTANCHTIRTGEFRSFDQISFTKTTTVMTTLIFSFWMPQAVLSLWIFVQNLHPPRGIPVALSVISPVSVEAAEIIPVLCYLTYDIRLRSGLLEICDRIRRRKIPERLFSKK